jgi:DNA primase
MDVLALRQAGLEHTVAVSGTALSDTQAHLLGRHVQRVVLLFDGDPAGQKAVQRTLPALLREGLGVRVALLPSGEDPDSLVRTRGRRALEDLVTSGANVVAFIVSLCRKTTLTTVGTGTGASGAERVVAAGDARAAALRQLVELTSVVPDRVDRRLLVEEASRQLDFDEQTLAREVEEHRLLSGRRAARQPQPAARRLTEPSRAPVVMERDRRWESLIALGLCDRSVLDRMRDELLPEDVPEGPYRRVFVRMLERYDARGEVVAADLTVDEDPETLALVSRLALARVPDDREQAVSDLLENLMAARRQRQIKELMQEIRRQELAGAENEVKKLMQRVQELLDTGRT